VILAVGNMVKKALSAAALLEKKRIHPTVVNMRFVKPFDEELVLQLVKKNRLIVTMEDNIYSGGFSERIQAFLQSNKKGRIKCLPICFPDAFIEHGDTEELYEKYGLDAQSVAERIEEQL
jgi:1-deoxy-D-xylulose-5-phosphate synthase